LPLYNALCALSSLSSWLTDQTLFFKYLFLVSNWVDLLFHLGIPYLEFTLFYTGKRVCDVALIKRTLSSGKPKKGWEFGGEGTREQWGTKGISLRATWD
jgi:hypothetical protein